MTTARPNPNVTSPPPGATKPAPADIYRVPAIPDPAVILGARHPGGTVTAARRGLTGTWRTGDEPLPAPGDELLGPAGGGD